jgi:hypothetical protein
MAHPLYACPVCEYVGLVAKPEDGPVCSACGTEFEVDDRYSSHEALRDAWLDSGAMWYSMREPEPKGWDRHRQRLLMERYGLRRSESDRYSDPVFTYDQYTPMSEVRVEFRYA